MNFVKFLRIPFVNRKTVFDLIRNSVMKEQNIVAKGFILDVCGSIIYLCSPGEVQKSLIITE